MRMFFLAVILMMLLSACSNDSILEGMSENTSRDALIEKAALALDNKAYDSVISELAPIYTTASIDPRIGRLLASAYMGKAGIDVTLLMENLSDDSTVDPFDVLVSMIYSEYVILNEDERYLDGNATAGITEDGEYTYEINLLDDLINAQESLQVLDDRGLATTDDKIQLGIASAAHFIMKIGNQTAIALNKTLDAKNPENRIYGNVPVPINTKAYEYYKLSETIDRDYSWSRVDARDFAEDVSSGNLSSYQRDLTYINNAIIACTEAFSRSNKLGNELDSFLRSVLDLAPDIIITDELISEYGSDEINSYVNRLASQ